MSEKYIVADCIQCESNYEISYATEVTSAVLPEFCPFCGEVIEKENIQDESQDDDLDEEDDGEWEES
jgi:PHP family Zn ribbon phosphoesterase